MTTIAIVQSCYIPWKGYFDLIRRSDLFVLYDCVQYTVRDWRNRNRIKTPHGLHWLTIPIKHVSQRQRISNTMIVDDTWQRSHWKTIRHHYAVTPYFNDYADYIEQLYQTCNATMLSEINLHFLQGLLKLMDIATPLQLLREHIDNHDNPTDNLLSVCQHYGATRYLSGPSAFGYLDVEKFSAKGVHVEWMHYDHYKEYPQLYPPFEHGVSMLDMLFNIGPTWKEYMD